MRRIYCVLISLIMSLSLAAPAFARPDWPSDTGIQSEAGIVMDMDSGAVIFGQNIHEPKVPASITKLLTALVVIENGNLEDQLTFSHDAVYNVEEGSGNKLQIEEGDTMTVRECLTLMLLQSSNQAANALAEHVGGTREAFVEMMNQRCQQLGCNESHFANPSGCNDDTQRTTAYDMALISRAAFSNPVLLAIDSQKEGTLPPTTNRPNGTTYEMEHKLVKTEDPSSETYYPYAVAGKTGWTSQAGNTLVTYAVKDDMRMVAVTLKSTEWTHYSDTITILDFAFARFKDVNVAENENAYVTGSDPVTVDGRTYDPSQLYIDSEAVITLPNDAGFTDALLSEDISLPQDHPDNAVGRLVYTYNDRKVGEAWLYTTLTPEPEATSGEATPVEPGRPDGRTEASSPALPAGILLGAFGVLLAAAAVGGGLFWHKKREEAERQRRLMMRERRRKRLEEIGCSEEEFNRLLEERRGAAHRQAPDEEE